MLLGDGLGEDACSVPEAPLQKDLLRCAVFRFCDGKDGLVGTRHRISNLRNNLAVGVREDLLEVLDAHVADPNFSGFPCGGQFLHIAPRINERSAINHLAGVTGIDTTRPVDKIQVDVARPEILQAFINGLRHTSMPPVVQLGCQPDPLAWDSGGPDRIADFLLVAVTKGRVNMAVAMGKCSLHGMIDVL